MFNILLLRTSTRIERREMTRSNSQNHGGAGVGVAACRIFLAPIQFTTVRNCSFSSVPFGRRLPCNTAGAADKSVLALRRETAPLRSAPVGLVHGVSQSHFSQLPSHRTAMCTNARVHILSLCVRQDSIAVNAPGNSEEFMSLRCMLPCLLVVIAVVHCHNDDFISWAKRHGTVLHGIRLHHSPRSGYEYIATRPLQNGETVLCTAT